jgi:hypothetical protein
VAPDVEKFLTDWAMDQLVLIGQEHLLSRRGTRCGICRTRWPCRTYKMATGDPAP